MNGLSLCSGIGGLDLAFEWAGGHVTAFCEIEPFCQRVLHKHWPDVPIFTDIRRLSKQVVENEGVCQPIDIVYGGFPCQPFSVAGLKKGRDDKRYLWPEFLRVVGEIKPRWVVAENVSGILRIAADEVCTSLEREGYSVGIWDYEAVSVGAPHRRERIFFVAHTGRTLRQGISKAGDVREADGAGYAHAVKRPSSAHSPDTNKGRQSEPRMGGVVNGTADWLDGGIAYWEKVPEPERIVQGAKDRANRLKALGNAVVPQQVYPIFKAIMEADDNNGELH